MIDRAVKLVDWILDHYMEVSAGMLLTGFIACLIPYLMCQWILFRSF